MILSSAAKQGRRKPHAQRTATPVSGKRFKTESRTEPPQQPTSLFVPFERKYTPDDVNRLDKEGRAHRRDPAKPPDITGLAEKLRTIGRIVDVKCGRLAKLIDDMDGVTVEYCDEQGNFHSDKYSMLALYKIQQSYYGERGTLKPVDLWRGFDR